MGTIVITDQHTVDIFHSLLGMLMEVLNPLIHSDVSDIVIVCDSQSVMPSVVSLLMFSIHQYSSCFTLRMMTDGIFLLLVEITSITVADL